MGSAMQLVIKATSGTYNIDVDDSATIDDVVKKAMEKHKAPAWADGVQLKLNGDGDDIAENGSAHVRDLGFANGTMLKMAYYQDVRPNEARNLKAEGIYPGSSVPFLAKRT